MSSGELSSLILGESKKAPKVLREGYLTKQGGRIRSWKKRWFVLLDAQVVLYYKDKPADSKTMAQGGLSIVKCSVEVKDSVLLVSAPVSMAVKKGASAPKQSANRTFTMKGDDVVEWMSAIKKVGERCRFLFAADYCSAGYIVFALSSFVLLANVRLVAKV
jgi:hypothetical protein